MNKFQKIVAALLFSAVAFTGCESIFEADSDRLFFTEDHQIDSPNDTVYTMLGVLSKLQKLSDRYVVLGELRADLMDVTKYSGTDLRAVNSFDMTDDNQYAGTKDYYAVINNCNYLIKNIDTSLVVRANKAMYKEFVAAKAIRAWTYMQLALNFGKATYYTDPILSVEDAQKVYPEYNMTELTDVLIQDLQPWKNVGKPGYGTVGDINVKYSFFPIRFLLGDLYLWKGDYLNAAIEYHDLIVENSYVVNRSFTSYHVNEGKIFTGTTVLNWGQIFDDSNQEWISVLASSNQYGDGSKLDSLTVYEYELAPSGVALDNWENQTYYLDSVVVSNGDLRGNYGSVRNSTIGTNGVVTGSMDYISKYIGINYEKTRAVFVYRSALLYLRYAEAVNRLGKPSLAFAVVKYGLNKGNIANNKIVPKWERESVLPSYMVFNNTAFDQYFTNNSLVTYFGNIGTRSRGCGNVQYASDFKIPRYDRLEDSVKYVEDVLVEELALETAFEGNRFHDLMRVAKRRQDNGFLADRVAKKHGANAEAIHTKLMDEKNWYVPVK